MDEKNTEDVLIWYIELESRLVGFLKYIPYCDANQDTELPKVASIIIEAGSLIDTIFREIQSVAEKKDKDKLKINDFAQYFEKNYNLSSLNTAVYIHPLEFWCPFSGWFVRRTQKYKSLKWWQHYNELKHDRIRKINHSSLKNATIILCALHQLISQLPVFLNSLRRHKMLFAGEACLSPVLEDVRAGRDNTILVETKLFSTPMGREKFPATSARVTSRLLLSERLASFLNGMV